MNMSERHEVADTSVQDANGSAQQSVWQDSFVLQRVFSYVGPGQWHYMATVSKLYKQSYEKAETLGVLCIATPWEAELCTATTTLLRAAFASPSRVQLAVACGLPIRAINNKNLQQIAGKHSDLRTLQAAHKLKLPLTHYVTLGVARSGSVAKLEWLHAEQRKYLPAEICTLTINGGKLDALKWYQQKGGKFNKKCVISAAIAGRVNVLEFLHAEGFSWHSAITAAAARGGSIDTLRWLLQEGCPVNLQTICNHAATCGGVALMRLAQQLGGVFTTKTMSKAALNGSLPLCRYLLAEGCPWDANACIFAAHNGMLYMVKWLHENGCPWDVDMLLHFAAAGGRINVMQYMQQQDDVEISAAALTDMLNAAGANSKLAAAQWLRQQGAQWPPVLLSIAEPWKGESLAWARAEGCTSPTA
jgi:hypothetical protein